jgi:hypothetical protein
MVLGESANALTSFVRARFSLSQSGGRDGRRFNSSVHRIASREIPHSRIESSREKSFSDSTESDIFHPAMKGFD